MSILRALSGKGRLNLVAIQTAVRVLKEGGVVAFPTETFYGLAVDPRNEQAVERVFRLKGRQSGMAIPLIASDSDQAETAGGQFTILAKTVADKFWPGPVALVVDAVPGLAPALLGRDGTVAVRVSSNTVASALTRAFEYTITATSANLSSCVAATTAEEVLSVFGAELGLILDGGVTTGGLASTIVDARGEEISLVREGVVSWNRVLRSFR